VFLDYQLKANGMIPDNIPGYTREQYTHLTVAAAVASGTADVGLGIRAAAIALDLDFVPLATEKYELVIPHKYSNTDLIGALLALLHNIEFREAVSKLPGYSIENMGNISCKDTSKP